MQRLLSLLVVLCLAESAIAQSPLGEKPRPSPLAKPIEPPIRVPPRSIEDPESTVIPTVSAETQYRTVELTAKDDEIATLQAKVRELEAKLKDVLDEDCRYKNAPWPGVQLERNEAPTILLYTSPSCAPCKQWIREELPELLDKGWVIAIASTQEGQTPRFRLRWAGMTEEIKHSGYLTKAQLSSYRFGPIK